MLYESPKDSNKNFIAKLMARRNAQLETPLTTEEIVREGPRKVLSHELGEARLHADEVALRRAVARMETGAPGQMRIERKSERASMKILWDKAQQEAGKLDRSKFDPAVLEMEEAVRRWEVSVHLRGNLVEELRKTLALRSDALVEAIRAINAYDREQPMSQDEKLTFYARLKLIEDFVLVCEDE